MTKYKQYFETMLAENQAVFADFKKIHDAFAADPKAHSAEFNEKGEIVMEIIRDWEKRLCGKMESGKTASTPPVWPKSSAGKSRICSPRSIWSASN